MLFSFMFEGFGAEHKIVEHIMIVLICTETKCSLIKEKMRMKKKATDPFACQVFHGSGHLVGERRQISRAEMAAGSVQVAVVVVPPRLPQIRLQFAAVDILHDDENRVCVLFLFFIYFSFELPMQRLLIKDENCWRLASIVLATSASEKAHCNGAHCFITHFLE